MTEDAQEIPPRSSAALRLFKGFFRCLSPGTFVAAVVMFFLPWTDVSCGPLQDRTQFVTQSGFESARGTYTEVSDVDRHLRDEPDSPREKRRGPRPERPVPQKAPLLWVYFVVILAGCVIPFCIGSRRARGWAIMLAAVTAIGIVLVQAFVLRFPLARIADQMSIRFDMDLHCQPDYGLLVTMILLLSAFMLGLIELIWAIIAARRSGRGPRAPVYETEGHW